MPQQSTAIQPSLAQRCEDALAGILAARERDTDPADIGALFDETKNTLEDVRTTMKSMGIAAEMADRACFALAAFMDEVVARSNWANRSEWKILHFDIFHEHHAGTLFFDKAHEVGAPPRPTAQLDQATDPGCDLDVWKDLSRANVLEVFYSCLLLDFRGESDIVPRRYQPYFDQVRAQIALKPEVESLSPRWLPPGKTKVARGRFNWQLVAIGLYAVVLAGILLLFAYGT